MYIDIRICNVYIFATIINWNFLHKQISWYMYSKANSSFLH